ncbi:Copia protein [Durusdinium trenchii]|uniref:Copia protein n=1 Tax=Durusdinium trenchii TaxID=1381693 RepID=A0ABP0S8N4_9DINO
MLEQLNMAMAPPTTPQVQSAFDILGKTPTLQSAPPSDSNAVIMKALTAALTGDRKTLPAWSGAPETLRSWLRQLSLWELDNNTPKERWGLKIMQSFPEQSIPRRLCETIDIGILSSPQGYSAVLSAILQKYGPYIEAAAPAAIENFFYAGERQRGDTFSSYIAAKEVALQELESNLGEKLPSKVAGRILLRHAALTDVQRESLAIKYQAMMTFDQAASALRPLDRPEALINKVAKNFVTGATESHREPSYWPDDEEFEEDDEELLPDDPWAESPEAPEVDEEIPTHFLLFDPEQEYTEEEANYIWAYSSAYKDIRKELQSRRKGRSFFKPKGRGHGGVGKKGKAKGKRPSKGRGGPGSGRGALHRGTPEDLLAKTRCFSCGELGHISRDCPNDRSNTFFICRGTASDQARTYMQCTTKQQPVGLSNIESVGLSNIESVGLSNIESVGLSNVESVGLSNVELVGLSNIESVGLSSVGQSSVGRGSVDKLVESHDIEQLSTARCDTDHMQPHSALRMPETKALQVYAGVVTEAGEGIVDTAAEEGVIGSTAMTKLRAALMRFGLQPVPAAGTTVCAGIGGNAKVAGVFDVPLGICKCNVLLRITEIQDEPQFTTPLLLPISFIELVGGIVDTKRNLFLMANGRKTPMRRTPSGHRAISVLEFKGRWTLPPMLCSELGIGDSSPFHLERQSGDKRNPVQQPEVAVWLKLQGSSAMVFMGALPPRKTMVHPSEIFNADQVNLLSRFRIKVRLKCLLEPTMINRLTQWRAREDEEDLQTPKPRCMGQAKTLSAWHRLALKIVTLIIHSTRQSAMDYLLNKSKTPVAKAKSTSTPKKETKTKQVGDGKVRRGLGQELPRSKANKTWAQEPTTCAHDEDKLRMRAGRGQHWWTCLDCGARWQRLEWEMDKALNTGASSSQDAPTPVEQEIVSYAKNPPRTLPGPRHRPEVPALTLEPVPDTEEEQMTADQRLEALLRQSAKTQGRDTQNVAELPTSHDCTTSTTMEDSSPKPFCLKSSMTLPSSISPKAKPPQPRPMPKASGPSSTSMSTSQTRSAVAALTACVTILCFVPGSTCHLDWIGPRLEATGKKQEEFEFLLSTSCKELGRTDFDGEPKSLERGQRQYLVGHLKHFNEVIGEVYSPPRCTKEARKQGFKASIAMDLSTGWDFREPKDRRRALQCIAEKRPAVLVLSPPCTAFSRLRALTSFKRREADVRKELEEAMTHMRFCISLCKLQQKQGRGFILEQPRDATSWTMPEMVSLLEEPEVYRLCLDLCQFGLRATKGPYQGQLVKKPTALISNIPELAKHVEKKCDKSHAHGQLLGGAAKPAAEYTPSFVQAILNGVKEVLGLKVSTPTSKSASTSHWVTYGRTLGAAARNYATDQVELEEEVFLAYQSFGHRSSFPVNVEEDVDMEDVLGEEAPRPEEPEEHDAVSAVRRELRGLQDNPGFAKAMQEVETFEDMNDEPNTLAPQLRREVHRVHRNIGHPGKEIFLRALKNAGVRDEILQWTKAHFRCPTCEARTRPSPARPGHLLRALEFNQVVGADLCFADLFNEQVILLNVLCWGTNFQQAYICKDKSAEEVLEAFMRCWIQPFGVPSLLVLDRGKEFDNHLFKQTVGGLGVGLHYTDPQSPWQNSRTEKAGGLLKEKLRCTIHETTASREELQVVLAEVVAARNRYMDRFGFSPMQRVFGKNLRLPSSLLSTDTLNRDLVEAAAPDAIKRSWDIRDAAAREWLKRQDSNAVRRSLKANSRTADLKPIPAGTWIYVFRDTPSYRGWVGPGVVIAEDFTNRSAWVSMRGRLWKASREQIRPATPEEELGAELILELSQEMLQKLKKPGQIVYQDITQEDGPAEDDLDGDAVRQVLRVRENDPHGEPHPAAPAPAPVSQTDSTHQPEDVEMDSEEPSSLPTTSLNPSRRVSILEPTEERLPMEGIVEEEGAAPEASASEQPRRVIRVDENGDGAMTFGPIRRSDGRLTEVPETPPVGAPMPYPMNRGTPPLPRPPPSSYYIEVIDFDKDEDLRHLGVRAPFIGATWRFDREQRKPVLLPRALSDGKTFHGAYAEASYCYRDKCHYVTKSKASFGQVQFSKLDEKEKEVFRKARKKELDSLISNGAVRVLSLSESRAFERDFPDQVIDSKFVDRYKPKDIGTDTIEEYKRRAIQEGALEKQDAFMESIRLANYCPRSRQRTEDETVIQSDSIQMKSIEEGIREGIAELFWGTLRQDCPPSELYTYVSFCKKMHTEKDQQKISIRSFRLVIGLRSTVVEDDEVRAEMMKVLDLAMKKLQLPAEAG